MCNTKPTLVILAAGMGSRYGGLKQLDKFTQDGATIMDFSIYDAIEAGFGKFVFIIRKSFEDEFKKLIENKLRDKVELVYVFQEIDSVPEKYINPERKKPWGTGHAFLMLKNIVKENFAIINADDFYGKKAFEKMADCLINTDSESYNFNTMAYYLENTVSDYGYVSRGECKISENGCLTSVTERTHIEKIDNEIFYKSDDEHMVSISGKTIVSMNFWGFTPKCFEFGSDLFIKFLEENKNNLKAEFYIPTVVNNILNSKKTTVKVLKSNSKWFGVTYKEDKKIVQQEIQKLIKANIYPSKLW
ncbi:MULTISPECIES: nucleotidyltransferase family protein [unclassified Cellulophaga]|uniref:nucleotidyltransferase family protein n=1 Tax=unclassified Cellulophaga TaxID=2634405 RepID=UPI0026E368C7|nr:MULTISPECIES: sugar phosphate nucleotidyltransferase [unclassified Cellulophaga]MDO6492234.1 sugar phosphate nucleotidyltransferase [Cellulophaga sp. 2_MG-2023]MDO6493184.1 sugar phosphate nucleotidyltransferase [Cellulophaga sp. 3_MG-2023]